MTVRQGATPNFSICKGWSLWSNSKLSELDSRRECLQTMAKSTCHMTVYEWKNFVYKCLPVNKLQDEIIEIDSWLKYALKTQTKLKRHVNLKQYLSKFALKI